MKQTIAVLILLMILVHSNAQSGEYPVTLEIGSTELVYEEQESYLNYEIRATNDSDIIYYFLYLNSTAYNWSIDIKRTDFISDTIYINTKINVDRIGTNVYFNGSGQLRLELHYSLGFNYSEYYDARKNDPDNETISDVELRENYLELYDSDTLIRSFRFEVREYYQTQAAPLYLEINPVYLLPVMFLIMARKIRNK